MWKYVLPLAGFGLLVVAFYFGLQRNPSVIPSPLIGKPAPVFSLPNLHDPQAQVSNANYRGRPYLLNVWGTWCVGCRQEHDLLNEIAQSSPVPMIGLNWKDDSELAKAWLEQLGNPYAATAVDQEGRVAIDWGVYGAPETFLVSADGQILHKHVAPLTREIWERDFVPKISAAIGIPAPAAAGAQP